MITCRDEQMEERKDLGLNWCICTPRPGALVANHHTTSPDEEKSQLESSSLMFAHKLHRSLLADEEGQVVVVHTYVQDP